VKTALERGFDLSKRQMNSVVNRVEQLCDLVNSEESIRVEDEDKDDLAG